VTDIGVRLRKAGAGARLLAGFVAHLAHERRLSRHGGNYRPTSGPCLIWPARPNWRSFASTMCPVRAHNCIPAGSGQIARAHAFGVRGFFRSSPAIHGFSQNPCAGLRAPKSPKRLPHALSPMKPRNCCDRWQRATWQFATRPCSNCLLFGSALSELAGLATWRHRFTDATVRVTGKGTRHAWSRSAARHSPHWRTGSDSATRSPNGRGGPVRDPARHAPGRARDPAPAQFPRAQAGHRNRVHRTCCATRLPRMCPAIKRACAQVQKCSTRQPSSTTQVYTHLDFQHLAKVYDAAHRGKRKKA